MAVRNSFTGRVGTLRLDNALLNPGRNKQGRNTAAETVEFEGVVSSRWNFLGVSEVIRSRCQWWRNVVVETTCLIVGQDEEGLVPLGTGAEGIVDVFDEGFAVGDETRRVHGVSADVAAGWVDEGEFGELACVSSFKELLQRLGLVGVAALEGPVEEVSVDHAGRGVVVHPSVAAVGELLEDGFLL